MRVLIIEDEKPAANNLEKMLIQIDGTIDILDKIDSIDYLLKLIETDQLEQSLNKFKELNLLNDTNIVDIEALIKHFYSKPDYQERFIVHYAHKIKSIKTDDVAYFYVRTENAFLCTKGNNHYAIDYTLDKLEKVINPKIFFRVNRQYIINISCITNMYSMSKSRIMVELNPKPDEDVIVSYGRVGEFRRWLNE